MMRFVGCVPACELHVLLCMAMLVSCMLHMVASRMLLMGCSRRMVEMVRVDLLLSVGLA